jgi:hypothetical protein
MLAIDHKTYADYVEYNHARGYGAFPEDLWNALKEQDANTVYRKTTQ